MERRPDLFEAAHPSVPKSLPTATPYGPARLLADRLLKGD
jgi:hypothetical protein